jgi:hypothetical protein
MVGLSLPQLRWDCSFRLSPTTTLTITCSCRSSVHFRCGQIKGSRSRLYELPTQGRRGRVRQKFNMSPSSMRALASFRPHMLHSPSYAGGMTQQNLWRRQLPLLMRISTPLLTKHRRLSKQLIEALVIAKVPPQAPQDQSINRWRCRMMRRKSSGCQSCVSPTSNDVW